MAEWYIFSGSKEGKVFLFDGDGKLVDERGVIASEFIKNKIYETKKYYFGLASEKRFPDTLYYIKVKPISAIVSDHNLCKKIIILE